MAKKKSTNSSKKTVKKQIKSTPEKKVESMKEKIEIKSQNSNDKASRIVGTIFIGLGVLLVAFGIYSFIQFRSEPTYDETYEVPSLEYVTELSNVKEVLVKGKAEGYDNVAVFVNDQKVDEIKVVDGVFEYEYVSESEGEYIVSVAGLKGFPIRKISARSSELVAVIDQTPPSSNDVELVYGEETSKETFKLTGTVEANATVEVKRGVDVYSVISDDDGYFEIKDITLSDGKNVFNVTVSDRAGNSVALDEKVRVEYLADAGVNGDAVADEYAKDLGKDVEGVGDSLPQAAGELDNLLVRYIMIIFGIAAIFVFSGSSIYAFSKRK
jgi:hypothetical protein